MWGGDDISEDDTQSTSAYRRVIERSIAGLEREDAQARRAVYERARAVRSGPSIWARASRVSRADDDGDDAGVNEHFVLAVSFLWTTPTGIQISARHH
jgi:hypothetical protein